MRVRITVTDDQGRTFEGEADVVPLSRRSTRSGTTAKHASARAPSVATPVFSLNPRAFMNKYGRKRTGSKKFTLLLACLAKGDLAREVTFDTIKSQWDKMKSLIGKFNPSYSIRAKENGWVETKKQGVYVLMPPWKEVLSDPK